MRQVLLLCLTLALGCHSSDHQRALDASTEPDAAAHHDVGDAQTAGDGDAIGEAGLETDAGSGDAGTEAPDPGEIEPRSAANVAVDFAHYNPNIFYKLVNKHSQRVLAAAADASAGAQVVIADDTGKDEQLWSIRDSIQGYKRIVHKQSGLTLSTNGAGASENGALAHLYASRLDALDQDWTVAQGGADAVKVINGARNSAALSLVKAGSEAGTSAQVWDDIAAVDQDWLIVPVQTLDANATYHIVSKQTGLALSIVNGSTDSKSQVNLWSYVRGADQAWKLVDIAGGFYHIVNTKSGRLLSLSDGQTADGSVAMIFDDVSATDQAWSIQADAYGFYHLSNQRRPEAVLSAGANTPDTRAQLFAEAGHSDQGWALIADGNEITINTHDVRARVSPYLTGVGIEDVNHEVYGGLYSQLIFGESFQEPESDPGVSGMWRALKTDSAAATFALGTNQPFQGKQFQTLSFTGGNGEVGVENRGLKRWGIHFAAGKPYQGYVYLRSASPITLYAAAESATGTSYAETAINVDSNVWKRYDFTLTPSTEDAVARFALKLRSSGSVDIGYVFFQPGPWGRFKDLPVRKDIADALAAQGNTILRFGGSAILQGDYRWKNMVGPRELRHVIDGWWYHQDTNGWGIAEFLSFAEALGALGVPTLNIDESPQDMADLVDYLNGPVTTTWGAKRAADGRPEPFGVQRLELGNEQLIDDAFATKFNQLAEAIWAKDPNMVLAVGDMTYFNTIVDPTVVTGGLSGIKTLAPYQTILDFAAQRHGKLAIDLHIFTWNPEGVPGAVDAVNSFDYWLHRYQPALNYELDIFELNADHHDIERALANALCIGLLAQHGTRFKIVSSANALQPDGQNDNGWDQGLVFFDTQKSWLQPPGYVTQMLARNFAPTVVSAISSNPRLSVTAKLRGKTLSLEVVNMSDAVETPTISLQGFAPKSSAVKVSELAGGRHDVNTAEHPSAVAPHDTTATIELEGTAFTHAFAPNSFTILQLE